MLQWGQLRTRIVTSVFSITLWKARSRLDSTDRVGWHGDLTPRFVAFGFSLALGEATSGTGYTLQCPEEMVGVKGEISDNLFN